MFFTLGWLAAIRNLQRSTLAVVSVALATVVLVSALIMAGGEPGGAQFETRTALGGDIVVLPEALVISGTSSPAPGGTWEMIRRSPDNPGLFAYFFPEIVRDGIMGQESVSRDLTEEIRGVEGVLYVTPYRTIPARMVSDEYTWWVQIRARDPLVDEHYSLSSALVQGRILGPADQGEPVCMLENYIISGGGPEAETYGYDRWNGIRAVMAQGGPSLRADASMAPGDSVRLVLPGEGDAMQGPEVTLDVVGTLEFTAGRISWLGSSLTPAGLRSVVRFADDDPPPPGRYIEEPLHFSLPEIWVSEETFDGLLAQSGGGPWAEVTEYLVVVSDLSRVNVVADQIREATPGATVMTTVEMVSLSDHLPMVTTAIPPEDISTGYRDLFASDRVLLSSPRWFEIAFMATAVVLAGLLYLGNLYVLIITRSKQLATLKALGSHNWQLLVSSTTEVLVISALGTLAGYLLCSPMLIHLWRSNAMGPWAIAMNLLRGLGLVAGVVFCVSLLVAAIPFLRMMKLSPGEVMRNG